MGTATVKCVVTCSLVRRNVEVIYKRMNEEGLVANFLRGYNLSINVYGESRDI